MRIVQLNLAADPALDSADALLDRYHTLTGWSRALSRAGAEVHVVQRFTNDDVVVRDGATYAFVKDGTAGMPSPWATFPRVLQAAQQLKPGVVHLNGLMFPGMTRAMRTVLGPAPLIVLQDHAGHLPRRALWPYAAVRAARWGRAFVAADAVSFTASELASRWYPIGLPANVPVLTIAEASTELEPLEYALARQETGVTGAPAILWVGRLNANKDPQTVLTAIELVTTHLPAAHFWMIVPPPASLDDVRRRIDGSAALRRHVTIVGPVEHRRMPAFFSSADIYVSGSRHEGSGYALIESMACGALPCVTDIAAFRALTHGCGELWRAGTAEACAAALLNAARRVSPEERAAVRAVFAGRLGWDVVAADTLASYRSLMETRAHR